MSSATVELEPFRYRSFVVLSLVHIASTAAFQMFSVAVGWQMYAITHDPLSLGLVGLATFAPTVVLTFPAGHMADRYDRRTVVRWVEFVGLAAAGLLAGQTLWGNAGPVSIYAAVVIAGAVRAFDFPALQALTPSIVPIPVIPNAVARATAARQIANIGGPALGGILYTLHPAAAYGSAALLYVCAGVLAGFVTIEGRVHVQGATLRSMFDGLRYTKENPLVFGALTLDLVAVIFGGATALLPIFASNILETGPWGLGLLQAAIPVGGILTGLLAGGRVLRRHVGVTLFAAVFGFGLATIAFGVSRSFAFSLVALAASGAANMVSAIIRLSLIQIQTPARMQGRVNAVNSLFTGASNQLGAFESGLVAAWVGAVPSVVIGGVGTIVVALLWMRLFPSLLRTTRLEGVT